MITKANRIMKMPTIVYRRRIALIEEFGFNANEVPEDGFSEDYFEVVGNRRADTNLHAEFAPMASNSILKTRIYWPDAATRARAKLAMEDDFRESFSNPTE